jgi:hypothetical protein
MFLYNDTARIDLAIQAGVSTIVGWKPKVVSGLRDVDEQSCKVAVGYSPGMNSKHLIGEAADVIDLRWGWSRGKQDPFFLDLRDSALSRGLEWGGFWTNQDVAHIQIP